MLHKAMASLAQARLVPLTQRYLALSTWRPEFREHLATSDNSALVANRDVCLRKTGLFNQANDTKQRGGISARNNRTSSGHHCCNTKDLLREMNTPKLISRNYLGLETLVKTNPSTIMDDDIIIRNCYREKLTRRGMLFTRRSFSQQQFDRNYDHYERNNKNKRHRSSDGSSFFPFYVMFGFLGMFRKPSASELEEERARLTDEQKIKKMKPVELAIARGVLSMCDQNYDKANQYFHDALHMAQDENDEQREDLILNLIASNYFESGDFKNAEKLFIDLMKRMIAHDESPTSPAILELSLKLASIYSKKPETVEKALKGYKFVISSLLNNLDDIVGNMEELDLQELSEEKRNELALLGWSYDWFAKHLLIMNDYSSAANMLLKAYEISSKVLGPLHDQTLILLNDIGTTLAMNNSPDDGKKFIKKAVDGAITSNSIELASFYVNLGLVHLNLRDLTEAKQYCEYSLGLAKKNPEHYNSHEVAELSQTCLSHIQRLLGTER